MSSSQSHIKIYGRIRPVRKNLKFKSNSAKYTHDSTGISFNICRSDQGIINNQRETFDFRFDGVFGDETGQEEVFDVIAKPVVNNVLEGYNGKLEIEIRNYFRLRSSM